MADKKVAVRNAADPEQVGKAGKSEQFQREQELNDLRAVIGEPAGRRVCWRLLGMMGVFETGFSTDALEMAYRAGRRDIGLGLLAEIGEANPEAWLTMQIEANLDELKKVEPEPTKNDG